MRSDIAVLYRSNAQSRVIEHALFSQGIAYRVYGGLRFFERQEVKHALAYLRLLANADDDGAFLRVVNFPTRGIGARSIEQLQDAARAAGCSLSAAVPMLSGKAGASLGNFARLIEGLREQTRELMLPEVIEHMLERSGLMAHYRAEREGADRLENLSELINAGAAFIQEADGVIESGDLAAFLAHAALEAGDNQAAEGKDAVQMMTIHAAKGLEFHAVFVTGIEEGLFPHEQSVMQNDGLEEERRLMYVAITRARARLYLSFTQQRLLHGQSGRGAAGEHDGPGSIEDEHRAHRTGRGRHRRRVEHAVGGGEHEGGDPGTVVGASGAEDDAEQHRPIGASHAHGLGRRERRLRRDPFDERGEPGAVLRVDEIGDAAARHTRRTQAEDTRERTVRREDHAARVEHGDRHAVAVECRRVPVDEPQEGGVPFGGQVGQVRSAGTGDFVGGHVCVVTPGQTIRGKRGTGFRPERAGMCLKARNPHTQWAQDAPSGAATRDATSPSRHLCRAGVTDR